MKREWTSGWADGRNDPLDQSDLVGRTERSDPGAQRLWCCLCVVCAVVLLLSEDSARAQTNTVETVQPARLQISGFGLLRNRALSKSLLELQPNPEAAAFDANFIEDAFLILNNRLAEDGFLNPVIVANLTLTNERTLAVWWDGEGELEVPRDIEVETARFEVIRGVLFFYDELVFDGLSAIPEIGRAHV